MITITFPDGKSKQYPQGITLKDIAFDLGQRLGRDALAGTVNDKLVDLSYSIHQDAAIAIITSDTHEGEEVFHHSTAHVLAEAVTRVFPHAKPTIGPSIEGGFYYDFDVQPLTPEDLAAIEGEMQKIVASNVSFERKEISIAEAKNFFSHNPYKLEIIEELAKEEKALSYYQHGNFKDLCRGPHIPETGRIKAFKLTKVSGCYWRGDATKQALQRIYGVSFPEKKQLADYIQRAQEAEKRDHRKIGEQLDLFSFHDEGRGFPFWHAHGMIIWNEIITYWREMHARHDYDEIKTPIILNKELWLRSGHWDHYKENMYFTTIEGTENAVKPMNCPGGLLVYKSKIHSYREFPIKNAELGHVHRHELSGVLHGLFRVRSFTQDDAHIFCLPEQLKDQIKEVIALVQEIYKTFGFTDYHIELSTRPEKSMGSDAVWEQAESALAQALQEKQIAYKINPGDGAFYGPKIDFHIKDCMGRRWQCGTIQVDFSMPERFDISYEGADGQKHRPVMVHRALLGSLERFVGILIEQYAGKLPLWLSPTQVIIMTVADRFNPYAEEIHAKLREQGIRSAMDLRSQSIPKKVRDAQLMKIPFMLTIGEKEMNEKVVAVRTLDGKVTFGVPLADFIPKVILLKNSRALSLDI
ncbi:threonine--tRNA ligase [Candidatus Woesearchaeota archaeon]|nr:threonine--tRNA ligase [Candidatus Woesearchaeota archaeon]